MSIFHSAQAYSNALSFQDINDETIDRVEVFIREEFDDILKKKFERKNIHFDYGLMIHFYGDFKMNVSNFRFNNDDRRLILQLVMHVEDIIKSLGMKDGLSYFHDPKKIELCAIADWYFVNDCNNKNMMTMESDVELMSKQTQTHYVLNKLLETANQNMLRPKGGYRFDSKVKSFAVYFRILAGRMAYQTLQANLELSLPSLSTTDRFLNRPGNKIVEGVLRCEELLLYLKNNQQKLDVSLSEDATRIENRIQYDRYTNQLVGFVLPTNEHSGLPIPFIYKARSAPEIVHHFSSETPTGNYVNTVMAKPIGSAPAFCLLIFCSDNKYTSFDVSNRWDHITAKLQAKGISVISISSDADPKNIKAMKVNSLLGVECDLFACDWFRIGKVLPPFYFQDTPHNLTKLRNFFLKTLKNSKMLPFGKFFINAAHLMHLVTSVNKGLHGLTYTTLNSADRQNVDSAKSMCNVRVISTLQEYVEGSDGTVMYLKLMSNFYESFADPAMLPIDRIKKVWYSLFIIRIWRESIRSNSSLRLAENFLTSNCYSCLEMNAHSLVCVLVYLKESNQPSLFVPNQFNSQACETFYRQIRSLTSTNSTVANCSMNEILHRIKRIQILNDIGNDATSNFLFPRSLKSGSANSNEFILPTRYEIIETINECRALAISDAIRIGLIMQKKNQGSCRIQPYFNQRNQSKPSPSLTNKNEKTEAIWSRTLTYLRTITLKNYAENFGARSVEPDSPYVDIPQCKGRIVVKKTSFCWLLRSDHVKLSSDRLERVKAVCGRSNSTKSIIKFKPKSNTIARVQRKIKKTRTNKRTKSSSFK